MQSFLLAGTLLLVAGQSLAEFNTGDHEPVTLTVKEEFKPLQFHNYPRHSEGPFGDEANTEAGKKDVNQMKVFCRMANSPAPSVYFKGAEPPYFWFFDYHFLPNPEVDNLPECIDPQFQVTVTLSKTGGEPFVPVSAPVDGCIALKGDDEPEGYSPISFVKLHEGAIRCHLHYGFQCTPGQMLDTISEPAIYRHLEEDKTKPTWTNSTERDYSMRCY